MLAFPPCPDVCRAEDGLLMALIELALCLVYTCALLIKSCDASSLGRVQLNTGEDGATRENVDARFVEATASATCKSFGLGGDASGELY